MHTTDDDRIKPAAWALALIVSALLWLAVINGIAAVI